MFQLIVAVISIALVAILAIASIYYGGSAFQRSGLKAQVDAMVNAGQQISGAQSLYQTDLGISATTVAQLQNTVNGVTYLSAAPAIPSVASKADGTAAWSILSTVGSNGGAFLAYSVADTTKLCQAVATQGGNSTAPQFYCSDASGAIATDQTKAAGFTFKL